MSAITSPGTIYGVKGTKVLTSVVVVFHCAALILLAGCQTTPTNFDHAGAASPAPARMKLAESTPESATPPAGSAPVTKRPTPPPEKIDLVAITRDRETTVDPPVERRIALLLPLSGRAAQTGRALLDSAQLALFEVADDDLQVLIFDTKGTPVGAEDAARLAVAEGAKLILGPLFGDSAAAVRSVTFEADVNVVSFSNNKSIAGDGVYVIGFLPDQQIRRVISFASHKGYGSFGALLPSNEYGELTMESARKVLEESGKQITKVAYYDPDETDHSALVRKFSNYDSRKSALVRQRALLESRTDQISKKALRRLANRDTLGDPSFEALLFPAGGRELMALAPLLAFYDVDPARVRLLGATQWDETHGLTSEPALFGGWYAAPPPDTRYLFEEKFEKVYRRPPLRLASLGYDAMLLAVALSYGEGGPNYGAAALTDARGFSGVDGIFRLLPNGANQRGLAVIEVTDRELRVIDPAPTSFTDLGL